MTSVYNFPQTRYTFHHEQGTRNSENPRIFQQCTDLDGLSRLMDEDCLFTSVLIPPAQCLHRAHVPRSRSGTSETPGIVRSHSSAAVPHASAILPVKLKCKMITYDQIDDNAKAIGAQLDRFIGFDGKNALLENNKNWLADLNYIDFLRDIGSHFSVNRMLTFEAYKKRMETGLTFVEFNYQLLQSYDFLQLNERHGVRLQIGGDDQWGNIVAGIELVRRKNGNEVFGLTFPLITTSDGKKMGKTEKGALFLDPAVTTPYDFFQYWRNVTDADVRRFMLLFTFLPVDEIDAVVEQDINAAKERLAYEVTTLIHGKDEADKALAGAKAAFGGGGNREAMPTVEIPAARFAEGIGVIDLFFEAGLAATKSDARRLVQQGGARVAENQINDVNAVINNNVLDADGELILRAGKKKFVRVLPDKRNEPVRKTPVIS